MIGDLMVGNVDADLMVWNVDASAGLSVDVSRSKLASISDSSLRMLRWCRFLRSCHDGVETMYNLGGSADDTIFSVIWCLPLLTHTFEPSGSAAKGLVQCLRSY